MVSLLCEHADELVQIGFELLLLHIYDHTHPVQQLLMCNSSVQVLDSNPRLLRNEILIPAASNSGVILERQPPHLLLEIGVSIWLLHADVSKFLFDSAKVVILVRNACAFFHALLEYYLGDFI